MRKAGRSRLRIIPFIFSIWVGIAFAGPGSYAEDHSLTLHVEDAVGRPGGRIAFLIGAYASRPIGQGQLCFMVRPPDDDGSTSAPTPLLSPTESVVFSQAGDTQVELVADEEDPQRFILRFSSPSASVNVYAGPLAVVFFQLHEDAPPGSRYELLVDAADTRIVDDRGQPLDVNAIGGMLSIRQAAEPYAIAARTVGAAPGDVAFIGVHSFEPVGWSRGIIGLRYDPEVFSGPPVVLMDPRHGQSVFSHDLPTAGLLFVEFQSTDGSLNSVPGQMIRIYAPTSARARPGSRSLVSIDPAISWIAGEDGRLLPLTFEAGELPVLIPADDHARARAPSHAAVSADLGERN